MTREEIIAMFRVDNPEFTVRAITNPQLHSWCKIGDKEVCARTKCIKTDFTFNSVATTSVYTTRYDLTAQNSKFYAIDDYPGGGVSFDDKPLTLTSPAELDEESSNWRSRAAGTPEKYYRRGKWLYFDRPVRTADLEIRVYASLIANDFDDDNKTPFNELTYLEPYHYAIVLYLQKKAKMKKGSTAEELKALGEYNSYIRWMHKEVAGGRVSPMQFRPPRNRYSTGRPN